MRGAGEVEAVHVGFLGGMGWEMAVFLGKGEVMWRMGRWSGGLRWGDSGI